MRSPRTRELTLLLLGDIVIFYFALWATLTVRYWSFPSKDILYNHLVPFSLLFLSWIFIFFIAGLYEKHTVFFKSRLVSMVTNAMVVNILFAALFFFFVPIFGIAPKTNLAIYLLFAIALVPLWRIYIFPLFLPSKRQKALLIGEGPEVEELVEEVNTNQRYDFEFVRMVGPELLSHTPDALARVLEVIEKEHISIIVADARNKELTHILPFLFSLTFLDKRFSFVDFYKVYEDIFDRIPLSPLEYSWFLEHVRSSERLVYDYVKRFIDIVGAVVVGTFLIVLSPFVILAIKLEDGGEVFISQKRMGKGNTFITVYKFRTMQRNDTGAWQGESTNRVTKTGAFLRKTSIDELPQVWNIFKGEMSLIGPRNDIVALGERLKGEIPYYEVRYVVRPGITGWAQTHQVYAAGNISPQSMEESKLRLSYDLFYVKNRSLLLDGIIAFRTFATLLSRFGLTFSFKSLRAKHTI